MLKNIQDTQYRAKNEISDTRRDTKEPVRVLLCLSARELISSAARRGPRYTRRCAKNIYSRATGSSRSPIPLHSVIESFSYIRFQFSIDILLM